jgi:hypothetical protein
MISLAVLKADILYRLQPGEIWWVSSIGDDWRQQYQEFEIPSLAILRTPTNMLHESLKMTKEPKETHQDASQ